MKQTSFFFLLLLSSCHYQRQNETLSLIQIQDRNGLIETVSTEEKLTSFADVDFLGSQPYKKVMRVFKKEGKNRAIVTSYHPNGLLYQYLEAQEMRANGMYREWFSNGQLKIEAKVIGGTADLTPNGQEDWVFDSVSSVWDEQGNLIATIPYVKGALDGLSIYYFPNGTVSK